MFALTPGDPAGIGPDILIQVAQTQSLPLIVFGDPKQLAHRAACLGLPLHCIEVAPPFPQEASVPGSLYVMPIPLREPESPPGRLNGAHRAGIYQGLDRAIQACMTKECRGLITGPVHKAALHATSQPFHGHTEYLSKATGTPEVLMLFTAPDFPALALLTRHIPLAKVPEKITASALNQALTLLAQGLSTLPGTHRPLRIGVLGLNPHAGEGGLLGSEEESIIRPALTAFSSQRPDLHIEGPLAPDSAFLSHQLAKYDGILALYHDQGLGPYKALTGGHAVQMTIGLPFVRLSVDHGTALDLAGTGRADLGSFQALLALAQEIRKTWVNA